jgi:hypothetical protein
VLGDVGVAAGALACPNIFAIKLLNIPISKNGTYWRTYLDASGFLALHAWPEPCLHLIAAKMIRLDWDVHCPEGAEFSRPFGAKDVPNIANMKMGETFPIACREYSQRSESRWCNESRVKRLGWLTRNRLRFTGENGRIHLLAIDVASQVLDNLRNTRWLLPLKSLEIGKSP